MTIPDCLVYCNDNQLQYARSETIFDKDHCLVFDDAYRLAHLPLVAPEHPLVIRTKPGTSYQDGVHDTSYSIAIPIDTDKLFASNKFQRLSNAIATSSFAGKIS